MGLPWLQQTTGTMTSATTPIGTPSNRGNSKNNNNNTSGKRYTCPNCPYGTDRRDLYTRHENIHREEKPFHCYVCLKPFNRADHVKKHFLRMHREHRYELSRIRKTVSNASTAGTSAVIGSGAAIANDRPTPATPSAASAASAIQPVQRFVRTDVACASPKRTMQNGGGCNGKSQVKGGTKRAQERRYTCCYCSWSGVDNWCLKRHLNTHLKPYACALCDYKAARAERLATHVFKVHNKHQCSRCSFLGEDAARLQLHQLRVHRANSANAPTTGARQTSIANNYHRQPAPPSGEGQPPPTGPPIFPAKSVVPSTALLGKMGLSERKIDLRYDDWFAGAQPPARVSNECQVTSDSATGSSQRRSRKQSAPRKVLLENCDEKDDDCTSNEQSATTATTAATTITSESWVKREKEASTRDNGKITKDYSRCYRCPENASSEGQSTKLCHTKASLAVHTLWRHRRRVREVVPRDARSLVTDNAARLEQSCASVTPITAITTEHETTRIPIDT